MRHLLLSWFAKHKRELPWRGIHDPYATWVSEIMLQQTQVATVIEYFNRWMQRFPTVEALASAPLDDALSMWAGLGYYRRARMLHQGAQEVLRHHGGQVPDEHKALLALPGIGRYTAGAIASIAFEQPEPIVDGNVERILARLRAVAGDPKDRSNQKVFWRMAKELVDPEHPGDFNQSMMELGATVCTPKNPMCMLCPVRSMCQAYIQGDVSKYPAKVKRAKKKKQHTISCVMHTPGDHGPQVYVTQRPSTGLLAGMWEFLCLEVAVGTSEDAQREALRAQLDALRAEAGALLHHGQFKHVFSHISMSIDVWSVQLDAPFESSKTHQWVELSRLDSLGLSASQVKAWKNAKHSVVDLQPTSL